MKNKIAIFLGVALSVAILSSCGYEKINTQKEKDMDFTVVSQGEMPDEVKQIVEERKENEFKVTYSDNKYTYIIVGYGKQKFNGYSINVEKLYETRNAIYVKTVFQGPKEYTANESVSYPYIVIKVEYSDKNIIFSE